MEFILSTGRSIWQGEGIEAGCDSELYFDACARVEMDPDDMERLGLKENDAVKVKTRYGEVVVYAKTSTQAPHRGLIFMPFGTWANVVVQPSTECTGMPNCKCIPATTEKTDERVLGAHEAIKIYYADGEWGKRAEELKSYYDIH
ncbi:MAG: molybdopterin dinucleotide binding domain-containing protein [Methanosarcinales archaeon Met12]|nr:MAG: molybdopterin dinucleotide binding domain-containing protein [Methanosarcinales archaeon Met12]